MTTRRPVRCRFCYERGHNVNGCEKMKEHIKNNPTGWYAQRAKDKAYAAKHRKCSYCSSEGHNRKTCSHILNDKLQIAAQNINYRKKFAENIIRKQGIAPGALVTVARASGYDKDGNYKYDYQDALALVTDIYLDEVLAPNVQNGCQVIQIQFMNIYDYNQTTLSRTSLHIPNWFVIGKETKYPLGFKLVSPGHYEIENEEEWCKDKVAIERICNNMNTHRDVEYAMKDLID